MFWLGGGLGGGGRSPSNVGDCCSGPFKTAVVAAFWTGALGHTLSLGTGALGVPFHGVTQHLEIVLGIWRRPMSFCTEHMVNVLVMMFIILETCSLSEPHVCMHWLNKNNKRRRKFVPEKEKKKTEKKKKTANFLLEEVESAAMMQRCE